MKKAEDENLAQYAAMFAVMSAECRLYILRKLLAHPDGMVVGDLQADLQIPNSTLSHHLDMLKREDFVSVRREGNYLWYSVNTASLQKLLGFLYTECCARDGAAVPENMTHLSK